MKIPFRLFGKKKDQAPVPAAKIEISVDGEFGSSGTNIYGGYLQEDYLDKMNGVQRAEKYHQMSTDYQIKMLVQAVSNIIKSADWWIEDSDIPEGEEDAKFIEKILFHNEECPWGKFISEVLSLIRHGYSLFEIIHKVVYNDPEFGTYIGVRKFAWRSQRTIYQWNIDRKTETLESVTQIGYGDAGKMVTIPADFLLLFNTDQEGSNFEGVSFLRACFGPWSRKNTYLKLNAAGIEKYAIPTPMVEVPDQLQASTQYDNLVKVLQKFTSHQKNFLTYPAGWKLDLKSNSGFDPSKVEFSVDAEDKRTTKAFVANFLELGMHSHGSHALSTDLSDFFIQGLEFIAKDICDRINLKVVRELILINKGPRKAYPKLKCSGISDKAGKELSEVLKNLFDSKIIIPDNDLEDSVRERYRLPPRSEEGQRQATAPAIPGAIPEKASFYERVQFARWKSWEREKKVQGQGL